MHPPTTVASDMILMYVQQRSGSLHCSSAWLSRAGEDFGVRKINQDSALAVGSYSIGDALFGVFDGHGPQGMPQSCQHAYIT